MRQSHFAASFAAAALVAAAPALGNGEAVPVAAKRVFVPTGFDDNDTVLAVIEGYLTSTCDRIIRPVTSVDAASRTITVTPYARHFDVECLPIAVPFSFEVQLGQLDAGDYSVVVPTSDGPRATPLAVSVAKGLAPDDYLYAPVDAVDVAPGEDGGWQATISGRFTNSCMRLDDVRVVDTGAVVDVLPMAIVDPSDDCRRGEWPYSRHVMLPPTVDGDRHLLHVRSLNGAAVTRLFGADRN